MGHLILVISLLGQARSATAPASAGTEIDAAHFGPLIETLQGGIRDISFVFEGENEYLGDPSLLSGITKSDLDARFQYSYAYRSDGATALEGFYRLFDKQSTYKYQKTCFLKGNLETVNLYPDRPGLANQIQSFKTDLNSMYSRNIPAFNFMWFYRCVKSYAEYGYRFLGWEDVDGHRCLCVSVGRVPVSTNKNGMFFKLWIDINRGGHPLKVELYNDDNLMERVDKIGLRSFRTNDEKEVWVPVSAELNSFNWNGRYFSTAIVRLKSWMVDGSLFINTSLPDSLFSVRGKSRLPETPYLRRAYEQFRKESADNAVKTDPKSVRDRLDRQLKAATEQAEELTASKPADSARNSMFLAQCLVVLAASTCLFVTVIRRYRAN
jgi:hypothetical protein